MAKKTSKQGKKANKNDAFGRPLSDNSEQSVGAARQSPKQSSAGDKPADAKELKSAKDKKPDGKPAKPAGAKSTKEQQKPVKSSKSAPKKESIFRKVVTYFKNVRLEVKRTTWPSRPEVLRMSLIVVGALIFFGVYIFGIDWATTAVVEQYAKLAPAPADPAAVDPTAVDPAATDSQSSDPATTPLPDNSSSGDSGAGTDASTGDATGDGSSEESESSESSESPGTAEEAPADATGETGGTPNAETTGQ
jgi:preprotein translocase subunit SecE